ncbi:unnamed protein product [Arabidopsis lyrata]|nr:unnamed protein product [Arabidopsis lyrata]
MKRKNEKDTTNPSKLDLLDSLPLDLKMAILTRLSAKSLKNFRCVSKMWSSIIRSRGFIDSFFSMSAKQSRFIVSLCNIVFGEPEEKLILFFSFSHDEGDESSSSSSLVPNFEMALPAVSFSFYSGSCASLHGILTVETEGQLMMCNPSTEQVVKLTSDCIFVGYDPIDDQYKVLSWDNIIWEDPNAHLKHKVLTLGDGQGWRHIKNTTLPYMAISPNVCINGFLYYGTNRAGEIIMAPSEKRFKNEPFILAAQAKQVSFIPYPKIRQTGLSWFSVIQISPRGRIVGVSDEVPLQNTQGEIHVPEHALESIILIDQNNRELEEAGDYSEVEDEVYDEFDEDSESYDSGSDDEDCEN